MGKVQVSGNLHWDGMKPDGAEVFVNFGGGPLDKDMSSLTKGKQPVDAEGFRRSHHPLKRVLKAVARDLPNHVKMLDKDVIINTLTGKKSEPKAVRPDASAGFARINNDEASKVFGGGGSVGFDKNGNLYSERKSVASLGEDLKQERLDKVNKAFCFVIPGMKISTQYCNRMKMELIDGMEYNDAEKKVSKDLLKEFSPKEVQKCLEENSKNFVGIKADKFVDALADKPRENAGRSAQRSVEKPGRGKGFDITD